MTINILFLLAKLMHFFRSKKTFCLLFKTIPLSPAFLQSLNVSIPIVGRSALRSCFFFGYLIKTPFLSFVILID